MKSKTNTKKGKERKKEIRSCIAIEKKKKKPKMGKKCTSKMADEGGTTTLHTGLEKSLQSEIGRENT